MLYLAYFILAFSVCQLLVALSNLLSRQGFHAAQMPFEDLLSVLIPVRNEAQNIGNLLNDLQLQAYKNIEIIVFNDLSTDGTEAIVLDFAAKDQRIVLLNANDLPPGWLGKNFACHSASIKASGKYFLFLDADVRVQKGVLHNAVARAEKHQLGLLSIFPKQQMRSMGERFTVPNMNYILLSLLPLGLVLRSRFTALAAANGQFMLFNSTLYNQTHPHEKFKSNRVEDIEIARYFKKMNFAVECLTGDRSISCRMYTGFDEAVHGFSKNIIRFFGDSFALASLFWLFTTWGFIPILLSLDHFMTILYLFVLLLTRIVISYISKQNRTCNILLMIPQQLTMGWIIYKAFKYKLKNQYQWKGRNIS